MRINSIWYSFLILLLGFFAATPWIDGLIFKKNYQNLLLLINSNTQFNIKILRYHTGWLRSYTTISVESKKDSAKPISLTIEQQISHGPIVRDATTHKLMLGLGYVQSSVNLPKSTGPTYITADILANFAGDFNAKMNVPDFITHSQGLGDLSWQGVQGYAYISMTGAHLNKIQVTLSANSITSTNKKTALNITGIYYQADMTPNSTNLWNINGSISLPQISWANTHGENFIIEGITGTLSSDNTNLHHVDHIKSNLAINNIIEKKNNDNYVNAKAITLVSDLQLTSNQLWNVNNQFSITEIDSASPNMTSLIMKNVAGKFALFDTNSQRLNQINGNIQFDSITYQDDDNIMGAATVNSLAYQFNLLRKSETLWNLSSSIHTPEISINSKNIIGDLILKEWKGHFDTSFDTQSNHATIKYDLNLGSIAGEVQPIEDGSYIKFSSKNNSTKATMAIANNQMSLSSSGHSDELNFNNSNGIVVDFSNLNASSTASNLNENNIYNLGYESSFGKLVVFNYPFGLCNVKFSLTNMMKNRYSISQTASAIVAPNKIEISTYITPKSAINFDLQFKSADGDLISSTKISWNINTTLPIDNPNFLKAINVHFNFKAPIKMITTLLANITSITNQTIANGFETTELKSRMDLINKFQNQISIWVQQGYLKESNGNYTTTIDYGNGALLINGVNPNAPPPQTE